MSTTEKETMMVVVEMGMAQKEAEIPMAVGRGVGNKGWKFYVQG